MGCCNRCIRLSIFQFVTSFIVLLVVLAPAIAGLAIMVSPSGTRRPARLMVAGCTVGLAAAIALLIETSTTSARVGDVALLDLSTDRVSALLAIVVMATGAVVAGFSGRNLDDDHHPASYFALIGAVVAGSALVVLPGGPIALIAGWLISGWALLGLLGHQRDDAAIAARSRVARTLIVGDLALVAAVAVGWNVAGTGLTSGEPDALADLSTSTVAGVDAVHVVALLVVIAGAARSAMFPFHRWLLGTLAAPTPVSALVHAGFVSGAGLLLIRFIGPFIASDIAVITAFTLGTFTAVLATAASAMRSDVKGSLAWSTVGQMAFMVVQCAVGAFSSAVFHIVGHGMYKASLFLGAGDTVSAGLRSKRSPAGSGRLPAPAEWLVIVAVPTLLVAAAFWIITPDVDASGKVLIAVFAWASTAAALKGWLQRGPLRTVTSVSVGVAGAAVTVFAYFGGLRLLESFVKPVLPADATATVISPTVLIVVLAVGAAGILALQLPALRATAGPALRGGVEALTAPVPASGLDTTTTETPSVKEVSDVRRAEVLIDVSRAGAHIAPLWPLDSFVAVNPLGGLEAGGFEQATAHARRWLRGRTHLTLEQYRSDHKRGLTTTADLIAATDRRFADACARPPIDVGDRSITVRDIVVADLLHGPDVAEAPVARTALERAEGHEGSAAAAIDAVLSGWLTGFVAPATWPLARDGESFLAMSRRLATEPRMGRFISAAGRSWIERLGDDAASAIDSAFTTLEIADDQRVDELRGHLVSVSGWAGLAKWRTDWAHPDEARVPITLAEIAAARAMLEAAVLLGHTDRPGATAPPEPADERLDDRVSAVLSALHAEPTALARAHVAQVLATVRPVARQATWLDAQEAAVDRRLLSLLERPDDVAPTARTTDQPDAQLVFCIDVRSEGLRRNLEALGHDETLGFAGFFGIPMSVHQLGARQAEARCPVLVAPAVTAVERPEASELDRAAHTIARRRADAGIIAAHKSSKAGIGAPFVMAETVGWLLGPLAALRTFVSRRSTAVEAPQTSIELDPNEVLLEQRVFFAEALLNTMGLTSRFAPIVALCGHTSRTTNNPHATALECGACAGASGEGNARAVAALLNSPDVRLGLAERGIDIPDDTWFVAGLHDTVSDRVDIVDTIGAPASHHRAIDALRDRLEVAAMAQSQVRAQHLPGPAAAVRDRGRDWAQVRPEWGLARNAAFIIGPRSMTAGLDLEGRAFLHNYDTDDDPTGKVLETIMTAPLVVGHWISSQYYFSTVDPERFGAGDKLIHNPIDTLGVVSGDGGDLRVGLPLQSTHLGNERHHQPVRLLAVIEAHPSRIDDIIDANSVLQTLTDGSWLRIAARGDARQPWSIRRPDRSWEPVGEGGPAAPASTCDTDRAPRLENA